MNVQSQTNKNMFTALESDVEIYEPKLEAYIWTFTLYKTFTYCAPFRLIEKSGGTRPRYGHVIQTIIQAFCF